MEHIERAGVHSGDSIAVYPPQSVSDEIKQKLITYTEKMAKGLNIIGLLIFNMSLATMKYLYLKLIHVQVVLCHF